LCRMRRRCVRGRGEWGLMLAPDLDIGLGVDVIERSWRRRTCWG
jgi:hypothetical protein